jgi:hypothetical protein
MQLRRPRCRRDNNINTDPRKIGLSGMDWVYLTQDR